MKYRLNSRDPKAEYKKKVQEKEMVEAFFNVDLSENPNKRFMGVEFTPEELEVMQHKHQPEPEEEFTPKKFDEIEDQYIAEQLGLEIDSNGDLRVPKKRPKRRGVFF